MKQTGTATRLRKIHPEDAPDSLRCTRVAAFERMHDEMKQLVQELQRTLDRHPAGDCHCRLCAHYPAYADPAIAKAVRDDLILTVGLLTSLLAKHDYMMNAGGFPNEARAPWEQRQTATAHRSEAA